MLLPSSQYAYLQHGSSPTTAANASGHAGGGLLAETLDAMIDAKEDARGRWREDARENWESEIDKKDGSTSARRRVSRERREGIRPKGEHARPAASFFSGR